MSSLEILIIKRLRERFRGLRISKGKMLKNGRRIDLYVADDKNEYFVEIKETDCNRVVLGEIIDLYSALSKSYPKAILIVVCRRVNREVVDTLKKLGIKTMTFQELSIPVDMVRREKAGSSVIEMSPSEQTAYFAIRRKGLDVIQTRDLAQLLNKSLTHTKNLIARLSAKGALSRIGRGRYVVIPDDVLYQRRGYVGDPLILMDQIMRGERYYVGYQSAANFHGLTHQIPYDTSVAVQRQRKPLKLGSSTIRFIRINEKKFFGFREERYSNAVVNVSNLEKTVLDCLDRPDLCGGISETSRIIFAAIERINWDRLVEYLMMMDSKALAQRLGFILEKFSDRKMIGVPGSVLDRVSEFVGPYVYPLDIRSPKRGKVSEEWRILENKDIVNWYLHA